MKPRSVCVQNIQVHNIFIRVPTENANFTAQSHPCQEADKQTSSIYERAAINDCNDYLSGRAAMRLKRAPEKLLCMIVHGSEQSCRACMLRTARDVRAQLWLGASAQHGDVNFMNE